jgi:tripartite-type tricarboxylate transporter receptor subunit TctC
VKELIALARGRPGALALGQLGDGGRRAPHGALCPSMTKTTLLHVPYKGGGPA